MHNLRTIFMSPKFKFGKQINNKNLNPKISDQNERDEENVRALAQW